ncbi:MAG TPA: metallophosphoesterase family protein [Burkholderiaceae bacterium]|nr:metallophosphoesterase family protein [Burkholderiaceae bacterium]
MRIALLSDIHGNLPALHAVLSDVKRRSVDHIVNLGDSLSGPLFPAETADFLMQQSWIQLAGNHERQLLHFNSLNGAEADRFALSRLTPNMLDWLAGLPPTAQMDDEVLLCHGTPHSDLIYFLETVEPQRIRLASLAEIAQRRADVQARLICCGHTHVPRAVKTLDGTLIVNPGSVGLQAYDDNHPFPHLVENGSPDARYAIVERHNGAWHAALLTVPYGHDEVADLALANGRPDWAVALRSGFMPLTANSASSPASALARPKP